MLDDTRRLINQLTYHPAGRLELFRRLSLAEQGAVFESISPHVQQSLLLKLKDREIIDLLDQMDLQQAENILPRINNQGRQQKIIRQLKGDIRAKAEYFLRFHPQAALSLLNFNYLFLSAGGTIDEAAAAIDEHYQETGKLPEVLVHDRGQLIGEAPLSALVREDNDSPLRPLVVPVKTVTYQAEIEEIVKSFSAAEHSKVIVLDQDGSVLGLVYSDDALALFADGPASSLYDFAGVAENERPFDSVRQKVSRRYKWLIINLATAFIAAASVSLFKDTLEQLVILAIYMPVVAGMGGNAATQTLAVMVRGIAIGEVRLANGLPVVMKEVGAGFTNGLITGLLVTVVAILWNQDPILGLVIGAAMVFNLVIAGFFGAVVPLVMKQLGKDPATSATIFITTATDVFGFLAFLGLATVMLL
ncbi:MAG: magnesium transporter [Candidatus Paceibacterota bacterium]